MEAAIIIAIVILFLLAFMLIRTAKVMRPIPSVDPVELPQTNPQEAALRLSQIIRFETISDESKPFDLEPFYLLHDQLEQLFPAAHKALKCEVIGEASLLFTWEGEKKDLKPVLLAAHMDVVPADPDTLDKWTHPPFSGVVDDQFIWGRGTLDIKSQMVAILEAVEQLIKEDFIPSRTIYLAFGYDEEIGGLDGHKKIVEHLQEKGIHLAAMMDEGGAIMEGFIPGVVDPIALIGNAEKGHLSLKLIAQGTPGHSSMPGNDMAIGRLARALARLDGSGQPARLNALRDLYKNIGAAASFGMQFIFSNLWFFGPIVRKQAEANHATNAMIRTSTALTLINGGVKENVLPASAQAVVNFRLLPGDTIASVCKRVRRIIRDDTIEFEPVLGGGWEASPVSSTETNAYLILKHTIRKVFDGVPVAPYLMLGATDARHYAPVSDAVYRFSPINMVLDDLNRVHGIDERISIDNYARMIVFFEELIKAWCVAGL